MGTVRARLGRFHTDRSDRGRASWVLRAAACYSGLHDATLFLRCWGTYTTQTLAGREGTVDFWAQVSANRHERKTSCGERRRGSVSLGCLVWSIDAEIGHKTWLSAYDHMRNAQWHPSQIRHAVVAFGLAWRGQIRLGIHPIFPTGLECHRKVEARQHATFLNRKPTLELLFAVEFPMRIPISPGGLYIHCVLRTEFQIQINK